MDKLKQIQDKIAEIQAKSALAPELKAFATLFLKVLAEAKSDFSNISKENQAKIDNAFAYLEQEHTKLQESVSQVTENAKKDFKDSLDEVKKLISEIKSIEIVNGKDGLAGKDADEEKIVEEVLSKLPAPEEVTGEKIVDKINDLPTDDNSLKIDASHIKNLPEVTRQAVGGVVARNIYQLGDVALSGLSNGQALVWDDTNKVWENGTVGGGSVGPGTINEIAYFDTTNTVASLSTTTYPSLTELSYVKGVTSAIQTQLNSKQGTITLTTTGTSGAATLIGDTLNIPQYAASITGSDTQVLFFDGTDNPAGDAGFTYNKTTDTATLVGGITTATLTGGATASGTTKALIVNNGTSTGNIFEAQDNGTAVFTVADGGQVTAIGTASGVSAPQYSFIGDTDTGLMRTGANTLNIQAGGQYTGLLIGGSTLGIGWSTATVSTGNGTGDVTFTSSGYATGVAITGGFKINPNSNYGYMTNVALFNSNPTNFTNYSVAGTYANFATHRFGVMNMTVNAGQALTITDNATVKIDGEPTVSGAGIVQTNAHALWVVGGKSTFGGNVIIGGGASASELRFLEPSGSGTNYTSFKAGVQAGNIVYTLPTAIGSAGEVLTDVAGDGVLSWEAAGSGANTALSNLSSVAINASLVPDTDATYAIGSISNSWLTLYMGSGSTINFANGDAILTHSLNTLTLSGANFAISNLTASEILITDASKNIVSAPVATYPSLTELTYLKGVTSAIQTQLNAKGVGTVTSVAASVPTGLTISGSPVTTTGTLAIALDTGYVIPLQSTIDGKANTALSNLASVAINTTLVSDTDNTDALGTTAIAWSDLFLGSGAVITFNSAPSTADVTITHSSNLLTIAGGDLALDGIKAGTTSSGILLKNNDGVTVASFGVGSAGSTNIAFAGSVALGASNLTMTGSLAATGSRVTKGWFTDVESTNMPTVGGTAILTSLTAPQFTTIELGHATQNTLSAASGVLSIEGVVIPTISSTNTLTNKRITKRTGTTTSHATPTINTDNVDEYYITAQTEAITSFTTNLSGTPTLGQTLFISVIGTAARAITWGASFANGPVALPTTTVTTTQLSVLLKWDGSIWRCYATGSTV